MIGVVKVNIFKNDQEAYSYLVEKMTRIDEQREIIAKNKKKAKKYTDAIREAEFSIKEIEKMVNAQMGEFFNSIPDEQKEFTKTLSKYKLQDAVLQVKTMEPKFEYDEYELTKYLEENNPQFVEWKKYPKWGEYKKQIEIVDGMAVDQESGEILPIKIVPQDAKFEVKI